MPSTSSVEEVRTAFSPAKHGFQFVNNFSIDKSEIGLGRLRLGTGPLHFGLCGGMCLYALRKFLKSEAMPPARKTPAKGTDSFRDLFLDRSRSKPEFSLF